jgi:hypothetical protein
MPQLSCLKNFIGIEACNAPVYSMASPPEANSGLIINKDLPISVESIDKTADAEQGTFLTVWDEVQNRAIPKFIIRVKSGYKDLFGVCNLDDDWFCDNRQDLAYSLLYFLGSELMYERYYSTRKNSWTTIDRDKAIEMKSDFDQEFQVQLKSALEIINAGEDVETDSFSYFEDIP